MNTKLGILFGASAALLAFVVVACSDDSSTTNGASNNGAFTPTGTLEAGASTPGSNDTDGGTTDGGCPNKPAGCFCGTPATQADWLNRCTSSAAIKATVPAKIATTTDVQ